MSGHGMSGHGISGCTRRRLLAAGGAGLAASALGGCGYGAGPEVSPARTAADGGVRVPTADTPVGEARYYEGPEVVVTQPVEGQFHAFDAACPHQGCAASSFAEGVVVCPCHGSEFDLATGAVRQGPATTGLTPLESRVDGTDLVIRG